VNNCLMCVKLRSRSFLEQASQLLIEQFGFEHTGGSGQKGTNRVVHGGEHHHRADWGRLISNIFSGEGLHDSILRLAASLVSSGQSEAAAIQHLQSLMDASTVPKDDRWVARYDDIPRSVRSAVEKFGKPVPSLAPDLSPDRRLIQSSAEFVEGFKPPDYVIDGIAQRRYVYSVTGSTGTGKTAILLLGAAHAALGRSIGDRGVNKVRVIYFAGENPEDARMRWIAMAQQMDFDVETIDVHFIPGVFKISEMMDRIRAEINDFAGGVGLVCVDTSAAYFEGDNENDNVQQGEHARRFRSLTTMQGGPCVLVACHPPKNAGDDNLLPRGGGAFIAEMDGNLTAKKTNGAVQLHWQGKFRGPDFAPLMFSLHTVTHERLKDSMGRAIPTVVASHLSTAAQQEMSRVARSREDELLAHLANKPESRDASQRELASQLGWLTREGTPYQMLVSRTLAALRKDKLITIVRNSVELTAAGQKAAGRTNSSDTKIVDQKESRDSRAEKPISDVVGRTGGRRQRRVRRPKATVSLSGNPPKRNTGRNIMKRSQETTKEP